MSGYLNCGEGTKLMTLADAAIEGTIEVLKSVDFNARLRIFFVLNTDGEASDGVAAARSFNERFAFIMEAYPNMLPPRTIVMGIGGAHDQKVLGEMSVGESSYYNFPDTELQGMVDIVPNILAELSFTSAIKIKLHPSGIEHNINPTEEGNLILSGLEVAEGDTSITFPDGQVFQLEVHPVDQNHPSFKDLTLRLIKKNTLELIQQIKSFTTSSGNKGPMLDLFKKKLTALKDRYQQLSVILIPRASASASEGSMETQSLDEILVTQTQDLNWRRRLTSKLKQSSKPKESNPPPSDEQNATTVVFKVCESCLECLRLGSKLSVDLERDCLELLGSGGYEHFTNKQLKKLCVRATKQINPDSMEDIDAKVSAYSKSTPKETIADDRAIECWWTGESAQELAESEDVPVLVGSFPPEEKRNRGMSSVSSCLVIDKALIGGRIHVCLQPMSFRTIRGLLCEGKQISRGPDGHPINLIVSFMPDGTSEKSIVLAKMMSSLGASQLVTTNFNSTVGTMEFKNAVMTCLLAITSDHPFSELSCGTLTRAVESFYRYNFGIRYLKETLQRGGNFLNGATTSGDVSTFPLAIVDQMLRLAHRRIGKQTSEVMKSVRLNDTNNVLEIVCAGPVAPDFWRDLFFRILRDDMDVCFTAFCKKDDPLADDKRNTKQKEADLFVQILAEGLNRDDMSSEFTFHPIKCGVTSVARTCQPQSEKIEFDDYFEETDAEDIAPEVILLPPKPPLELRDMSFKEIIQYAVKEHQILPLRQPDQPTSLSHLDEIRGQILEKLLARLAPKTDFMVKCYNYVQNQNALTFGDDPKFEKAESLFQVLGLPNDSSAWEYLLEKLLLAVTCRTNSSYKKDKLDEKSCLNLPAFTVVETLSKQFSIKRGLEWETLRKARLSGLKNIFYRRLQHHPKKLALVPLRICGEAHFEKLEEWVLQNRKFSLTQSLHPKTKKPTGMAINTFMFPFSDYFMVEIKGSLVCDNVYGNKKERDEYGFLEHLHTAVADLYQQLADEEDTTAAYEKFETLFFNKFSEDVDAAIPFEMYTSLRVSQELETAPQSELGGVVTSLLKDYPERRHSDLANVISREFLWQTSPADYLNNYFADEAKRVKLTFEEFLCYLGLKETQVDEIRAARLAFDQPVSFNRKSKNKSAGCVNDGTTKKERKDMKVKRREARGKDCVQSTA